MTAREFAAAIDRPYPTVALWLRQNRVPGAYQEKVGDFSVWQIPVEAVKAFKPPKPGRPRTQFSIYGPIYSTVTEAPDWETLTNDQQNARLLAAIEQENIDRVQPLTLMETREENLRFMRRIIGALEKERLQDQGDAETKPTRRASNRTAAKKALKKMGKGGAAK